MIISTDHDPTTGTWLRSGCDGRRHLELYEGVSDDAGVSWTWRAVTVDSTADNIRPVVPSWDGDHAALVWLRGRYITYLDHDLDVVGIIAAARRLAPPPE